MDCPDDVVGAVTDAVCKDGKIILLTCALDIPTENLPPLPDGGKGTQGLREQLQNKANRLQRETCQCPGGTEHLHGLICSYPKGSDKPPEKMICAQPQ
jgi:hypothetical protein